MSGEVTVEMTDAWWMRRLRVIAMVLALCAATGCWPGSGLSRSGHSSKPTGTRVFGERGKRLGGLYPSDFRGGGSIDYRGADGGSVIWFFQAHQVAYFRQADCLSWRCGWGYAHMLPGGFWYVESFFEQKPYVRTIGTVRRRTSRTWDAFLGLGEQAHRIGWATGPHPGVGAAFRLLLAFGWQTG
jgi:hypothetical protein